MKVDIEKVMEDCCDNLSINNEYIGKIFQWLINNNYSISKDVSDDDRNKRQLSGTISEGSPEIYWYSTQKGKKFNFDICYLSDLRDVEGFCGKESTECWRVEDGEFKGNLVLKMHVCECTDLVKFDSYMKRVREQLVCNATSEYLTNYITYDFSNELIDKNLDYFRKCMNRELSGYKSLLFFQDFLDGNYII